MSFDTLLIANRGEIACRIIRSARHLGIRTVAVYSEADRDALHTHLADRAVPIGPAPAAESYLRADAIIAAALTSGAKAIHPGYGFLSENAEFAEAVGAAGLVFVGPPVAAIRAMGLKDGAKALMQEAGVPVVPGYHGPRQEDDFLAAQADSIGYPVLIKARAGGGGKGMRLVETAAAFPEALASARREAEKSFGDPACLVERFIAQPRHIEIQVFGDHHGNIVHLFERDCSLQRRHQKVVEEAPAPGMSEALRAAMGAAAVRAAETVGYVGAGTVEFIVDGQGELRDDRFWFMEMNTRLQVEHPVTEAITGLDLVALQLSVAAGDALPFAQGDLALSGHAVEARLYAEDPAAGFLPSTGRITHLQLPRPVDGLRIDAGIREGDEVSPHYDPMIAKIIAHGPTRAAALRKLASALDQTRLVGVRSNASFLARLLRDPDVREARLDTGLIARAQDGLTAEAPLTAEAYGLAACAALAPPDPGPTANPFRALPHFRLHGTARQQLRFGTDAPQVVSLETAADGQITADTPMGQVTFTALRYAHPRLIYTIEGLQRDAHAICLDDAVWLYWDQDTAILPLYGSDAAQGTGGEGAITAPMPGLVSQLHAAPGQQVTQGETLAILEAMKMEHRLTAPYDGRIDTLSVAAGDRVDQGALLMSLLRSEPAP